VVSFPVRLRLERLRIPELLAGAGGALLLVTLFLPWFGKISPYCVALPGYSCGRDFDAWQAFGFTDVLLLVAALAGIAMAAAASWPKTDAAITSAALTFPLELLATILVLYRLLDPVGQLDPRYGIFVGLGACAALTYGSWRAMRDERPARVAAPGPRRSASRRRSRSSSD
jgi:hypothetical protein